MVLESVLMFSIIMYVIIMKIDSNGTNDKKAISKGDNWSDGLRFKNVCEIMYKIIKYSNLLIIDKRIILYVFKTWLNISSGTLGKSEYTITSQNPINTVITAEWKSAAVHDNLSIINRNIKLNPKKQVVLIRGLRQKDIPNKTVYKHMIIK